jgi:hypothetical protein
VAENLADLATQLEAELEGITIQFAVVDTDLLRRAAAALRSAGPVLDAADAWIAAEVGFTEGAISARALYDAKSTLARAARGRRSPTPPPPPYGFMGMGGGPTPPPTTEGP